MPHSECGGMQGKMHNNHDPQTKRGCTTGTLIPQGKDLHHGVEREHPVAAGQELELHGGIHAQAKSRT